MLIHSVDSIVVVDFGGQYTHLIANRIRRLGVFSQIVPNDVPAEKMSQYKGIILSGGPGSVVEDGSPQMDHRILSLGIPVLGICYGHQLIAKMLGGRVCRGTIREYGIAIIQCIQSDPIFGSLNPQQQVWMSHGDAVATVPPGFETLAVGSDRSIAAMGDRQRKIYGLQFHPEVSDTPGGMEILSNFIDICGCSRSWTATRYREVICDELLQRCKGKKVFLLVSGGVDSTVAFTLLNRALGADCVLGLHIDNGLMRHEEAQSVLQELRSHGFDNVLVEDASADFLAALRGVTDPELKRAIIGDLFIEVKKRTEQKLRLNAEEWLFAQGTIYPDTIESAGTKHADRIKTHHNRVDVVMELIEKGLVVEPLAQLYKDEVRELGEALGLSHRLVWRHPFPGPGLAVRLICSNGVPAAVDPTARREVTAIAADAGYRGDILPVRCVGVQGDSRSYAHVAVVEGPRDWDSLERLSTHITNSITHVNRVVYALRPSTTFNPVAVFVTKDRLDLLRRLDRVALDVLCSHNVYDTVWQMPVILLPLVNERGESAVVLRPVCSQEAMTARFARLPDSVIDDILLQFSSLPGGGGPVFYDITHKPPGTIEWE